MEALSGYYELVGWVDRRCKDIQARHAARIACIKGCPGNCCRIHLSLFTVEAVHLAGALAKLPRERALQIRSRAERTPPSGPCPLLENGACGMYGERLILCRTHGLPMLTRYRGREAVGCCQKNFRPPPAIPDDAVFDLDRLNRRLADVNREFSDIFKGRFVTRPRYTIAEALLLEV